MVASKHVLNNGYFENLKTSQWACLRWIQQSIYLYISRSWFNLVLVQPETVFQDLEKNYFLRILSLLCSSNAH